MKLCSTRPKTGIYDIYTPMTKSNPNSKQSYTELTDMSNPYKITSQFVTTTT